MNKCSVGNAATGIFHEGPLPNVVIHPSIDKTVAKTLLRHNGSNRLRIISFSNKPLQPTRPVGINHQKPLSPGSYCSSGAIPTPQRAVNTLSVHGNGDANFIKTGEQLKVKRLYEHVLVHKDDAPSPDTFFNEFEEINCNSLSNNDNKSDGSKLDPIDLENNMEIEPYLRHYRGKMYRCKLCDKVFTDRYVANNHRAIHSGEKYYKCSHCDRKFAQESARNRHEVCLSVPRRRLSAEWGIIVFSPVRLCVYRHF